jgi:hypothetical protein
MMTKRQLIPFLLTFCLISLGALGIEQTPSAIRSTPLTAPTYYIAINARTCQPDVIRFDGASNLPSKAIIELRVGEPYEDTLKDFTDAVDVPVDSSGFLTGEISPKKGLRFHRSLIAVATFSTDAPNQPASVLNIVGKKGEILSGVRNAPLTELIGLSKNPQLFQASGWYYGLQATALVPWCGEGVSRPH